MLRTRSMSTALCCPSYPRHSLSRVRGPPREEALAVRRRPCPSMFAKTRETESSYFSHWRFFSTMPTAQATEYNWIDGVERLEMYEPGGYHPVMIDDILDGRYRIVDKLGHGGYSTIWLAHDDRLQRYVAIKVGVSSTVSPSSPSRREPSILRDLSRPRSTTSRAAGHASTDVDASDAIPSVLDEFDVLGPNGTHRCYTVAPAQGNLREASFSRLFPIQVARALAAKLTMAVAYVHSRGVVHGG